MAEDISNKWLDVNGNKLEIKDEELKKSLSDNSDLDTFADNMKIACIERPCDTCASNKHAEVVCKACESYLCQGCLLKHIRSNIKIDHIIETIGSDKSPKKQQCAPCAYQNQETIAAAYCIECEEHLCETCENHHSFHMVKHRVITISTLKCCTVCFDNQRQREADNICTDCEKPLPLCIDCSLIHKLLKPSRGHNVKPLRVGKSSTDENKPRQNEQNKTLNVHKGQQVKRFNKQLQAVGIKNKEQPGKPRLRSPNKKSIESIQLTWGPPNHFYEAFCYQIRYKEDSAEWKIYENQLEGDNPYATISKLKSHKTYYFQVRMVNTDKEGPYSVTSDGIKTQQSAASRMLDYTVIVEDKDYPIVIRKVPFTQIEAARNTEIKSRKLEIGIAKSLTTVERTIMLVGATGSGKSTLVDGIANYVLGVNWDDTFRLTATDLEEDEKDHHQNQAVSQTLWITCYTFHPMEGSRINYTLNIIDTPGFGDTRGIERDQEIVEQIRQLFNDQSSMGIAFVDAVCFLVKAPDARLTHSQRYIFDSILSLFGNDIKENICCLVTFADGNTPPVLDALKESNFMFDRVFPFNNSGLFANNAANAVSLAPIFWEMGTTSFNAFFDHVDNLQSKSLSLTKRVLDKRKELELTIENILPMIDCGLHKVDELSEEIRIINNHQRDIEENRDFVYSVNETRQIQIDLPRGEHVTNCLTCHLTCHKQCMIKDDKYKYQCRTINTATGNCNQCNCHWTQHKNTPYIFEYQTKCVSKTYAEKLKTYNLALSSKHSHQFVICHMQLELEEIEFKLQKRILEVTDCTNKLKEIALRPNLLSVDQYIDLLIQTEKNNRTEGFIIRVNVLLQIKKKSNVTKVFDSFKEKSHKVMQNARQLQNLQ